jgi:hypothetical protein
MCSDETRKWKTHSSTREIGAVAGVHPDSFNSGEKSGLKEREDALRSIVEKLSIAKAA